LESHLAPITYVRSRHLLPIQQINLDTETRLITLTNVQSNNPDQHAFDRAQRRIQHMMERDSYPRFLQSRLFLELVQTDGYPTSTGYVSDN
jgi:regulator of G-protein signaling 3/regulator of G-protein signaling